MKKIFARISMELVVSDEEADKLVQECCGDYYFDSVTEQISNNEFDLTDEIAQRFLKEGTYSKGSSYIPEGCISDYEETVCISLNQLYNSLEEKQDSFSSYVETKYGLIRKNDDYYDFFSGWSNLRLCCDGEQCKVLERTTDYVKLIDVENIDNEELEGIDTTFKLSITEFNTAVFFIRSNFFIRSKI